MYKYRIHFLLLIKMKYTLLVSLGGCCETSSAIEEANTRHKLKHQFISPFSWLFIGRVDDMLNVLYARFKPFARVEMKAEPLTRRQLGIEHYRILLSHYTVGEWNDKWPRRVERFLKFVKEADTSEKILFIYKSHLPSKMTQDHFDRLVRILYGMNPNLQYDVLVVNEFLYKDNDEFTIISDDHLIYRPIVADVAPYAGAIHKCDFTTSEYFWENLLDTVLT